MRIQLSGAAGFPFALFFFVACSAFAAPREAPDLNPVRVHQSPKQDRIPIVENGKPIATLCLTGKSLADLEAVKELQTCIKLASGVELPVAIDKIVAPAIVIGDCPQSTALGIVSSKLPAEGFAIKTSLQGVFIVGNGYGLHWGIYEFIERFIGGRWYFPGDAGRSVPQAKSISVPATWIEDAPFFPKREIWPPMASPGNGSGTNFMPLHAALRAGNSWPHNLQVHTPDWSKIADYREHRPEVFQLSQSGQRDWTMLCYSNPRTLQSYLEQIAARIVDNQTGIIGMTGDTITVCPNDADVACFCPDCRKLWNGSAGQNGSASRIVANFTAKLAREVQKRWPDKTVLQLAYMNYTDAPDGIEFPSNVEIQICGMPGMALYKEPTLLTHELENEDKWIKLTGRKIQNWHYICWPEDRIKAPYQYPHAVQNFYRAARDKTVGTFINGDRDHWQRQHLSLYCWMKLLWNPDFNVDAAIDEYCRRMYGPAADEMRQLVKLQTEGWEGSRWPGARLCAKNLYTISYQPATRAKMKELVEAIRRKTKDDPMLSARAAYYTAPFEAFFQEAEDFERCANSVLSVGHAPSDPVIDGKLDDEMWKQSKPKPFVLGYERNNPQPKFPTTIQAVWTDRGVTYGFRMAEPTPEKIEKSRSGRDHSTLWWDDNIELLLDVTGKNDGEYYHFIISAAGVSADAHRGDYSWNCNGIQAATFIGKDFWSLEVFLPFSSFPEALNPAPGAKVRWSGNFTRHRVADPQEYQRLNTTYALPSENLSDFGRIVFE
jgi:hypothetical protein